MSPEYMFEDSFRNPRVLGPPGLISNNSNKKSCCIAQGCHCQPGPGGRSRRSALSPARAAQLGLVRLGRAARGDEGSALACGGWARCCCVRKRERPVGVGGGTWGGGVAAREKVRIRRPCREGGRVWAGWTLVRWSVPGEAVPT